MNPIILFRSDITSQYELNIAKKHFNIVEQRCAIPNNSLVIPRYSSLPYYKELEKDVELLNSKLINSYEQHRWIASFDYYETVKEYSPKTWDDHNFYQCRHEGPFVVKGKTNSRKHSWNTKMFAKNKREAIDIAGELLQDMMIGEQGIVYREFVPLKVFEIGLNGLPFSNEWRFFFYKQELLSYGYYWSIAENTNHTLSEEGIEFAKKIAVEVSEHVDFFVLDIAEKDAGGWILIEINDGTMSGLSENDPDVFYGKLRMVTNG